MLQSPVWPAIPLEFSVTPPILCKGFLHSEGDLEMSLTAVIDELPKPAWIALMVLGFIAFWPIGLAILAYLLWSGKMGCWSRKDFGSWSGTHGGHRNRFRATGNRAFDDYREETLNRLEEEQREFTMFLERLRQAKDQHQFDQFMSERQAPKPAESGSDRR